MRSSPRLWPSISGIAILLLLVLALPGKPVHAANNQVVMISGGDVEWALNARPPTVRYRVADPTAYGKIVYGKRDVRDRGSVAGVRESVPSPTSSVGRSMSASGRYPNSILNAVVSAYMPSLGSHVMT